VCSSYGSDNCSDNQPVSILPKQQTQLVDICPTTGCESNSTKAVVITHGWKSNAAEGSWVSNMANGICNEIGSPIYEELPANQDDYQDTIRKVCTVVVGDTSWDVWVIDWRSMAGWQALYAPPVAWVNAANAGYQTAAFFLDNYNYEHYHLIAHSAGSNLIDTATNVLSPFATIHETFLDAYHPSPLRVAFSTSISRHISNYGENANWVEPQQIILGVIHY